MPRMTQSRVVAVVGLAVALTACATPSDPAAQPSASADSVAAASDNVLGGLPECTTPATGSDETVAGLTVPDEFVVLKVEKQKPLTNITGFVPLTPAAFERSFATMKDITILLTENEVFEAELLVTNGSHRTFLKATATCSTGSTVLAVVAPEVDAEGLPVPQRATATPTPIP
jgi:hypothetical protein